MKIYILAVNSFSKKGAVIIGIEEIVQFELKALSKTICEYSTDNYISSYAEQIAGISFPEDRNKLVILIDKLLEWYVEEIKEIEKSEYVHSKESHIKSFKLLHKMKELLKVD